MRKLLLALLLAISLAGGAFAQQAGSPVRVQQDPTRLDVGASVAVGTNWNAVNTQSIATTATPQSGQYVYVTGFYLGACESNTTGTAVTNANFTTTGLGGVQFAISVPATLGLCAGPGMTAPGPIFFATPLKAPSPGTAVVLTSPSAGAQVGFATRIYYYIAP